MLSLVVRRDGQQLQRLALEEGTMYVGRGDTNDVVLDHPSVSRRHAELTVSDGEVIVLDLDSGIGVRVGDRRVHSKTLQPGDACGIGPFEIAVEKGEGQRVKAKRWDTPPAAIEVRLSWTSDGKRASQVLSPGTTTIGRTAGAGQIALDDKTVGRAHASIHVMPDGRATLRDLQSTNGTFVNGERVLVEWLKHGDTVQIGAHTFRFEQLGEEPGGATTRVDMQSLQTEDESTDAEPDTEDGPPDAR